MQYAIALLALAAVVSAQNPPGCSGSFSGTFEIAPVNISSAGKRDLNHLEKRQAQACTSTPVISISNGKLTDQEGRTGEIVSNEQFQFDNPTQPGALYTTGFSICQNSTLAVGGSAVFYSCLSGTFDNLYHESQGGQCYPVFIDIIPCVASSGASSVAPATSAAPSSAPTSSAATSTPIVSSASVSSAPISSAPVSSAPATSLVPITMTMAAPFPVANATTASPTTVGTTSQTTTSAPATFTSGSHANNFAADSFGFVAAALAALAMF